MDNRPREQSESPVTEGKQGGVAWDPTGTTETKVHSQELSQAQGKETLTSVG